MSHIRFGVTSPLFQLLSLASISCVQSTKCLSNHYDDAEGVQLITFILSFVHRSNSN